MTTIFVSSEKQDITNLLDNKYINILQNVGNNVIFLEVENKNLNTIKSGESFFITKESGNVYYCSTSPNVNTRLSITKAAYQNESGGGGGDITAGTGLTFDGTILNHSNSVQSNINNTLKTFRYDTEGHITDGTEIAVQKGLVIDNNILGHSTITQGQTIGATTNTDYKSVFFTYDNFGHIISGTSQPLKTNDNFREPNQTGLFTVAGAYDLYNSIESGGYTLYVYDGINRIEDYIANNLPLNENWILATTSDVGTGAIVDLTGISILFIKHTLTKTNTTPYNWIEEAYSATRGNVVATRSYCDWMATISQWSRTANFIKDISNKCIWTADITVQESRECRIYLSGSLVQFYLDFTTNIKVQQGYSILNFPNNIKVYGNIFYISGFEVITTTPYIFYIDSSNAFKAYRPLPVNTRIILSGTYMAINQ